MSSVASRLQNLKVQMSVAKVFQHLKTRSNRTKHSFGGAYISWGTAPLPSRSSGTQKSLSFPLELPSIESSGRPLSLVESKYCHLAPHEGEYRGKSWIVRAEEVDPTTWCLLNPVSRINNLLESTSPVMAHVDNPSNFRIDEVARLYTLVDNHYPGEAEIRAFKVIPLLNPSEGEVNKEDLMLLALDWGGKLAFWKYGDEHWTKLLTQDCKDGFRFTDVVSYKGKFYATLAGEHTAKVYEIDPTNPSIHTECAASFGLSLQKLCTCNVVDFNGRLHILHGSDFDLVTVCVLNEREQWEKVKEITCSNGNTLFILDGASFCIPTHLLGRGFDKDWICVFDHTYASSKGNWGSIVESSASIDGESYPNEKVVFPTYYNCFWKCDLTCTTADFYSLPDNKYVSLFFPPPPWLDWHWLDTLKGNPPVWFTEHLYKDLWKFEDIHD